MDKLPGIITRIIGITCVLLALAGYWYTYSYFSVLGGESFDPEIPHFQVAYLSMVGICLFFYSALFAFGIQFLALLTRYKYLFFGLLALELVYVLSIGFLWTLENQDIAKSVGAATGVANGGLVLQVISGFVVWAPILLLWASKRAHR